MENNSPVDNGFITVNNNMNNITNTSLNTASQCNNNNNKYSSTGSEYSRFNNILHKSYFKIAVIGAHNVGKTSFITRYVEFRFLESYYPTNKENHFTKTILFTDKNHMKQNMFNNNNNNNNNSNYSRNDYASYENYINRSSNDNPFQMSSINNIHNIDNDSNSYSIVDKNDYSLNLDGDTITLEFIDTVGQESKNDSNLNISYYKSFINLDGCILCYNVNNLDSFVILKDLWSKFITHLDLPTEHFPILLLGMKCDIRDTTSTNVSNTSPNKNQSTRQVSWDQGRQLSKKLNSLFFECSSRDNYNIDLSMDEFIKLIKIERDRILNIQNNSNTDKCTIM